MLIPEYMFIVAVYMRIYNVKSVRLKRKAKNVRLKRKVKSVRLKRKVNREKAKALD